MSILSNRALITAILSILAVIATFSSTDVDDKIVAGLVKIYDQSPVVQEAAAPIEVAPADVAPIAD